MDAKELKMMSDMTATAIKNSIVECARKRAIALHNEGYSIENIVNILGFKNVTIHEIVSESD